MSISRILLPKSLFWYEAGKSCLFLILENGFPFLPNLKMDHIQDEMKQAIAKYNQYCEEESRNSTFKAPAVPDASALDRMSSIKLENPAYSKKSSSLKSFNMLSDPSVEMVIDDDDQDTSKEQSGSPFQSRSSSPLPSHTRSPDGPGNESSQSSSSSDEIRPDRALPLEKVDIGGDFHDDEKPEVIALRHLHSDPLELDEPVVQERKERATRLRRTVTRQPTHSEDSYDDYSSSEEEEMRKTIMIGGAYQAVVPEGLCKYGESRPYKNTDKLLWDPKNISSDEIESYLQEVHQLVNGGAEGIEVLPMGVHTRDDEQALFLLMQSNHNVQDALKKRRSNPPPTPSPSVLWTDEECRNFENGLLTYGKDFHSIQAQKVRTRSVSEIVQFYYLWKKTERHDIFANKMRPEKKKYMLHPGVTLVVYELLDKENQKDYSAKDAVIA